MSGSTRLTDEQWERIAPHLPPPKAVGRPRAGDRATLDGILWMLRSGARWCDLPKEYGAATTVWRRLRAWEAVGVWESIWRATLASLDAAGKLEWAQAFLDGSFVPAKKGD